jgi:hypothetical protein
MEHVECLAILTGRGDEQGPDTDVSHGRRTIYAAFTMGETRMLFASLTSGMSPLESRTTMMKKLVILEPRESADILIRSRLDLLWPGRNAETDN